MNKKKGVTILVIIAIILAVTAITLNEIKTDVKTKRESGDSQPGSGEVGVEIIPGEVEDKSNMINQELAP